MLCQLLQPCLTAAPGKPRTNPPLWKTGILTLALLCCLALCSPGRSQPARTAEQEKLAQEVRANGWILYSARSDQGDWDVFVCRPDGSARRNLSRTPEFSEFSPQLSRAGDKLLFRRIARSEKIDNNRHGEQGVLVLARADASKPVVLGGPGEWPWASFNPQADQIASLSIQGISFLDLNTRAIVRRLPRRGFFQQMTWSPGGQWLCGVANSFGASWSIARMNIETGEAHAVNTVDCCTPDWFADGQNIIFSWRPPGQGVNGGYGWTQLWRADATGSSRSLVYGEDGRHVYGGNVSPDGRYVLFTGNMEEDGDPGNAGAPMGLMRLADAPIIGGVSTALRQRHPNTKPGPVLVLPAGWEPFWTTHDYAAAETRSSTPPALLLGDTAVLARELHGRGWIVFSAQTERGDWDLFQMRPDGSDRRQVTDTPDTNEAGARFSPDGQRLLYYRMPRTTPVDNNTYGTADLVIARADGTEPINYGAEFKWASWGPGGSHLSCLSSKSVQVIDCATRQVIRELPRKGLVSQLVWSPDGKFWVGTANGLGPYWNIGCLDSATGQLRPVSETDRYNCTPDWTPDSQSILYARGIVPEQGGRAELWEAARVGQRRQLLYAEASRHIYGACSSPDQRYLLFTRSVEDLGKVDHRGTTMAIIRRSDTPMVGDADPALRARLPRAKQEPRLDLGPGWEPHWTLANVESAEATTE